MRVKSIWCLGFKHRAAWSKQTGAAVASGQSQSRQQQVYCADEGLLVPALIIIIIKQIIRSGDVPISFI